MYQKLILPINSAIISASFMNCNYFKKFKFDHYGVDMYGSEIIWGSGLGIVVNAGFNNLYGYYCSIVYPGAEGRNKIFQTLVFNYFHMAFPSNLRRGDVVDKDTKIGNVGNTGTYASGKHLHLECFPLLNRDVNISGFMCDPFKAAPEKMINPIPWLWVKPTAPDFQSIRFADEIYTNKEDRNEKFLLPD